MTSTELLLAIRNLGGLPSTGAVGARDIDLLAHADQGLLTYLLPRLLNLREGYYVLKTRSAVSGSSVRLPSRAAFNKLHTLYFISGGDRFRLDEVDSNDLDSFASGGTIPDGYTIEGNYVQLQPDTGSFAGELEMHFYQRPGSLVTAANARTITDVDPDTGEVTLSSAPPSDWLESSTFDVHSSESGAELKLWSAAVSDITGAVLTFTPEIDGSTFGTKPVAVGDYVVLAGKSALPVLPIEMHPILARAACLQMAESTGYTDKATLHGRILDTFFKEITKAMETRVTDKPVRLKGRMTKRRPLFGRHAP